MTQGTDSHLLEMSDSTFTPSVSVKKTMRPTCILAIMSVIIISCHAQALGTKTKMYIDIAANITCFRRFNSTSQTGCSSHKDGNVGIVHVVSGREDTNWILTEGGTPPYVPVLYGSTTSPANLTELAWSSRVSAIVILDDLDDTLVGNWINFSSDAKCPNYPFSFYQERDKCTTRNSWNPAGYDLAHLDWPIPVMFLDAQADSDRLVNHCYKTFNKPWNGTGGKLEDRSYPLCALQLTTRMLGAVNTPTCMRRGDGELLLFGGGGDSVQCEPLGGDSIHMPLVPRQKKNFNYTTGSVTIVAARMDTSSLFANIGPGGDSVVTGLVTWMITAHLLSRKEFRAGLNSSNESIHFMLFNGEAWGYIGSSRILYDMAEGSFPEAMDETKEIQPSLMKVEHIKQWIEIGQVSPSSRGNPVLYVHSNAPNDPQVEKMTKLLSNYSNSKIGKANSGVQLPPSSLHSALKANKTIPGILLANFPDSSFQNSFYNGFKEVGKALNFECNSTQISALAQHLTTTAEALASSVYDLITNKGPSFDVSQLINVSTANELLHCYLCSGNCTKFREVTDTDFRPSLPKPAYPLYVSVHRPQGGTTMNTVRILTQSVLGALTGTPLPEINTQHDCYNQSNQLSKLLWIESDDNTTRTCLEYFAVTHIALSPAFINKDWSSMEYSTWTESRWVETTARIFLVPSRFQEGLTLGLGLIIFIISLGISLFCHARASLIYATAPTVQSQPS